MGADGSIIIDTRINTDGLNSGVVNAGNILNKLKTSIKGVGVAIGAAFAVRQIVQFGKEASKAAREASDSMMGLRSILEGQGRSFSDAKKFIDEYIQDGLIPATDATTAYKNLASRGYDDTQIQQVMTALKDASAYGRQASYSMGEAVKSATEGLKNENSVLVDNAGVTKNVAKMWEDYARSIGTTSQNLTQQQKIQAEVSGILAETRFQTGDAARVASTLTGEIQRLSFGFNNFKIAVGNIVNPILKTFLPVINAALNAVTRFANAIATFVNNFFGTEMNMMSSAAENVSAAVDTSAASTENLAGATEDAAKATKKAQKANKSYLSGLDDIKRFTSDKNAASGSSGVSTPTTSGGVSSGLSTLPQKTNPVLTQVESRFSQFAAKIKGFMEPLTVQVQRFAQIAGDAFLWFYNNVLKPLGTWTVNEVLPRFFQTLANVLNIFNNILLILQPLWQWFWNKILLPIATWTGGAFLSIWDGINRALERFGKWCIEHPAAVQTIAIVLGSLFTAITLVNTALSTWKTVSGLATKAAGLLKTGVAALSSPFGIAVVAITAIIAAGVLLYQNWDVVKEKAKQLKEWLGKKFEEIRTNVVESVESLKKKASDAFDNFWKKVEKVGSDINNTLSELAGYITGAFEKDWTQVFGTDLGTVVNGFFDFISDEAESIKEVLLGLTMFIDGVFAGDWDKAWAGIKKSFSAIWNSLVKIVKIPINGIIGLMNSLFKTVNSMLSTIENVLKFDFTIPNPLGGGNIVDYHWRANLPRIKGEIPYLAKGAVIPPNAPFMAMLGDQRHGTNIEAPLSTIEEALENVLAKRGVSGGNNGGNYRFTAQINRRTLFDEMLDEAKMRQMRTGHNPFEMA